MVCVKVCREVKRNVIATKTKGWLCWIDLQHWVHVYSSHLLWYLSKVIFWLVTQIFEMFLVLALTWMWCPNRYRFLYCLVFHVDTWWTNFFFWSWFYNILKLIIGNMFVVELSENLSSDLKKEDLCGRTLTLKLKTSSFEVLLEFSASWSVSKVLFMHFCSHFFYLLALYNFDRDH